MAVARSLSTASAVRDFVVMLGRDLALEEIALKESDSLASVEGVAIINNPAAAKSNTEGRCMDSVLQETTTLVGTLTKRIVAGKTALTGQRTQ
jgi:hypothetical protein